MPAQGAITSHHARATITTQLYNARGPMTIWELKQWLGHRYLSSTECAERRYKNRLLPSYKPLSYRLNEILARHPPPKLRVYAVWFNMYVGDERSKWPSGLLTDPRVVHFWHEQKVVGTWFGKHRDYASLSKGQILWDAFLLYGAESRWDDKPSHLISTGRTIVAKREELRNSLAPLLK